MTNTVYLVGFGGHRKLITLCGKFATVSRRIWQTGPRNLKNLPRQSKSLSVVVGELTSMQLFVDVYALYALSVFCCFYRDASLRSSVERIFTVWQERSVFEDEFMDQLLTALCKLTVCCLLQVFTARCQRRAR